MFPSAKEHQRKLNLLDLIAEGSGFEAEGEEEEGEGEENVIEYLKESVFKAASRRESGASHRAPTGGYQTLGFIVGMFKTESTKQINILRKTPGQRLFQRNFYEHIIRNENNLNEIREYIKNNPQMWDRDRNNPKNWEQNNK